MLNKEKNQIEIVQMKESSFYRFLFDFLIESVCALRGIDISFHLLVK
jgi:hypothetical protein